MGMMRAFSMLGAGMQGYEQGVDLKRKREREDEDARLRREDAEWKREQRDRQRTEWQMSDADREAERQAMQPVEAKPELAPDQAGPQTWSVGGQVYTDPGKTEAAVQQQNAPAARMSRAAAAVRDPARAVQLQGEAARQQAVELQLKEQQLAAATREFDRNLVGAARIGPQALAEFLSNSAADGQGGKEKFKAVISADGKRFRLQQVDDSGKVLSDGQEFDNDERGMAMVSFMFARGTPPERKLEHLRAEAKARMDAEDKAADNKRQDARDAEMARHNREKERLAAEAVSARSAGRGGEGESSAPVWSDKADERLYQHYGTEDPTTGAKNRDGDGITFSKRIAVGIARQNGGDDLSAVGQAIDIDNRLRAAATDAKGAYDAKKHRELRAEYLRRVSTPAEPGAAPAGGGGMAAVMADMQRTGTPVANFNIGGVQGTVRNPNAPQPAAAPRAPAAPAGGMQGAAAPVGFTGDPSLKRVMAESNADQQRRVAALAPAVEQLNQLKAQLVAAGRSGDQQAIARAAQAVEAARAAISQAAKATLGQDAQAFIATL